MKLLHFDGDGLICWYKQLEAGWYQLPAAETGSDHASIDATQLRLILDGIDLSSVKRRTRFAQDAASA